MSASRAVALGRRSSLLVGVALLVSASSWNAKARAQSAFIRSDSNSDGRSDISDGIYTLSYLFLGGPEPQCRDAADANDDGRLDLSDALFTFAFQFLGGPAPAPPWPACGVDPTGDPLGCTVFPRCPIEPPSSLPRPTALQENSLDDADAESVRSSGHVVLASGELRLDRVDLEIPGRGDVHFSMRRRYRSRLDHDGDLGHGWDFCYAERLYVLANGDVVRKNGLGHVDTWVRNADGSYTAPPGHFRILRRFGDGSFVLRSADGFKRFYDSAGRLVRYRDRTGNEMLFVREASGRLDLVVDVYGREIDFVYEAAPDGLDRLSRIVDFHGREVVYSYDERGDLVAVRSPVVTGTSHGNDFPEGRTERYEYLADTGFPDLDHNLASVTFPEEVAEGGEAGLRFEYGMDVAAGLDFDRVRRGTTGGTNASGISAGGVREYAYESLPAGGAPGSATLRVLLTERNGNLSTFDFDERGREIRYRRLTRGLREGEPAHYETLSEYDDDHLLTRRLFPEGNEVRALYDTAGPRVAQRNLVELRRVAGPRGGGEDLVWRMTYEPLFQQLSTITDPRGNASSWDPPLGAPGAARYTTRLFYDYQESATPVPEAVDFDLALASVPRGLGDLNNDERSDQVAGDIVRIISPTVLLRPGSQEALLLGSDEQQIITEQTWNDRGQILSKIDAQGNVTDYEYYPEDDPDGDGAPVVGARIALSEEARGYLRAEIQDSRISLRRRVEAPPVALETVFEYDPIGHVVAARNPRGVVTGFEVNDLDEVVRVVRGADVSDAVASGELESESSPFAYETRYHFDHNGRIILREEENRDGATPGVGQWVERRFIYDILGNVVEAAHEIDAASDAIYRLHYDPSELLVGIEKPEGNRVGITYDERNLPLDVTDGAGTPEASTTRRDYDLNGNLTRFVDAEDSDGDGSREIYSVVYDGFDRITERRDPLGNRLLTDFDPASNVVRQRVIGHPAAEPAGVPVLLADVAFHHDELDRVYRIDEALFLAEGFTPVRAVDLEDGDGDGIVSTFLEHDELSRPTFVVEDDGEVTRSIYDGADRSIEWQDAAGNRKLTTFDSASNPIVVRSFEVATDDLVPPEEWVTFFAWDQLDRLVRVSADHTLRFEYDSRDNLVRSSDAEGEVIADPSGLYPGSTNAEGNTRTHVYDGRGLLTAVIRDLREDGTGGQPLDLTNPFNPDGKVTLRYAYDLNARLSRITDDNGNETRFTYDALDRPVEKTHADGSSHSFTYDRDSNLVRLVDPNGTEITQAYDALDRLVHRDIAPAPGIIGTTGQTFAYDGVSRVTEASDDGSAAGSQVVRRVFDSLGRLLEEDQNGAVCSSVWSGDGKRQSMTYPDGRKLEYDYDEIDREVEIRSGGASIATFDWIGAGRRLLRRTHGNGTTLSLLDENGDATGYDRFQRVARLRHVDGPTTLADREYTYNRADHRTSEVYEEDGGRADSFVFDSLYRLASAVLAAGGIDPAAAVTTDYTLDGAGNRRETQSTTGTLEYVPNDLNEYSSRGGVARQYDANGNLVHDGARRYRYDWKNRLVEVADGASNALLARYIYDALDRRVARTVLPAGAAGGAVAGTFSYLYDDRWRVVEEELSGVGRTEYVWGGGVDELIQTTTAAGGGGPSPRWIHQDARANVVALSNEAGTLVGSTAYDEFGRHRSEGAATVPYLFQGQRRDPETGLYQFRHRYYDPPSGRFLTRDPVWDATNAGNQYTFAGNDPLTGRDPLGLASDPLGDVVTTALDFASWVSPALAATDAEKNWKDWVGYSGDGVQRESTMAAFASTFVQETPRSVVYGSVVLTDKLTLEKIDVLHEAADQTYVELGLSQRERAIHQGTAGVTAFAIHCVAGDQALMGAARGISYTTRALDGALGVCEAGGAIALDSAHATRSAALLTGTGARGLLSRLWYGAVGTPAQRTLLHEAVHRVLMGVPWAGRFQQTIERISWWSYRHKSQIGKLLEEWLANTTSNWNFARNVWWSIRNYWHLPRFMGGGLTATGEALTFGHLAASFRLLGFFDKAIYGLTATLEYVLIGKIFARHYNAALGENPGVPMIRVETDVPEPLVTVADDFTVGPGLRTTLDVGANDSGTAGAEFILVTDPGLHPDLFTWNGDGTLSITTLTLSGPVTLTYKVVRGDEESEVTTVTITPSPFVLFQLPTQTDPGTGEVYVEVPCLVLENLHYPMYQFRLTNNPADVCTPPHWHGFLAFPIDVPGGGKPDPDPPRCGYGTLAEVPQVRLRVPNDVWQDFLIDHIPPF